MRKYFLTFLLMLCAVTVSAATYGVHDIPNVQRADRTHYTSNPDGILSPEAVARIDAIAASLRDRDIAQIAVVAVDDIRSDDVFDFAVQLFGEWGVGGSARDNGVGILLVKDRREIRFVTGYGVEGVLPDAVCKRIQMKYMLPYFRQDDYSAGVVAGVEAVAQLLEGSELDMGGSDPAAGAFPLWSALVIGLLFVALPMFFVTLLYYRQKRCPKCHRLTLVRQSQQELQVTPTSRIVEYTFVCSHCGHIVRRKVRSDRNDVGGGRGGGVFMGGMGGGRSSGGFGGGGFGGGSFGGGGAGSRW